ncbi:MAG TPA: carboxypeptidase-like regulatory domain-containing protein, partial [Blastocatellia bacterium]
MKKRVLILLCVLLINPAYAFSQNIKSALSGRVIDPQGNVVTDAEIAITDARRGIERKLNSNEQGSFYQPGLDPGVYRITATKQGFDDYRIEEVELRVGETANLEIKLQVYQVREQVNVTAGELSLLTTSDTKQSRSF